MSEKIALNLTKIFKLGPDVSFNGSPTVSPITEALWVSLPFYHTKLFSFNNPASIYFLALSQAPPELAYDMAYTKPETMIPGKTPAKAVGPNKNPTKNGVPKTMAAGKNISVIELSVAILIDL